MSGFGGGGGRAPSKELVHVRFSMCCATCVWRAVVRHVDANRQSFHAADGACGGLIAVGRFVVEDGQDRTIVVVEGVIVSEDDGVSARGGAIIEEAEVV